MTWRPKITVLLCTVRPTFGAYLEHPDWHVLGKVIDDLNRQTMPFESFELVIIDGLCRLSKGREGRSRIKPLEDAKFNVSWLPPRDTLWTRNKKIHIPAYRNTGLTYARGELVVNLDDCCELGPMHLECYWQAYCKGACLAAKWKNDGREVGEVGYVASHYLGSKETWPNPPVWGFGSYPLSLAVHLNGYDEAYTSALEDVDWAIRLHNSGLRMALMDIPGFKIHAQSAHDPLAIDSINPIHTCCNRSFFVQRAFRQIQRANLGAQWTDEALSLLVGAPCTLLNENKTCRFKPPMKCAYLDRGFAENLDPLAAKLYDEPPVFRLAHEREKVGNE